MPYRRVFKKEKL